MLQPTDAPTTARTRTVTWADPAVFPAAAADGRSGLELMRAVAAGELPPPPIASLLGMDLVRVDEGDVAFALDPAEWMYNPIGSVHGGIAATILDSALGCAVHTTLPSGVGYTTVELKVNYIRAMSSDTGRVVAHGRTIHAGGRIATAEARLTTEADGALIAHASTTCLILR
jgi:uncharacterized protein (TIGR00369 family)